MNKKNLIIILTILLLLFCIIIFSIVFMLNSLNKNKIEEQPDSSISKEDEFGRLTDEKIVLTLENILNKNIPNVEKAYICDVYYKNIETNIRTQFHIYANIWDKDYKNNQKSYLIINLNKKDLLYDLKVKKQNITEQEYFEIISKLELDKNIEYLDKNTFTYATTNDLKLVERNLEYYKTLALYSPNEAYNILDEEYEQQRFGSKEKYFEYINNNKNIIENISIIKYSVEREGNKNKYIAVDDYENYYIMQGETIYDFKIQLDNYTIEDAKYISKYNSLKNEDKAQLCATKVIKMINSKDYDNLYKLINETYKNTNFPTINDFKKYINEKYYNYNIVSTTTVESNVNYYICTVKIKSGKNLSALETYNKIIIQLGEGTDFTISFVK